MAIFKLTYDDGMDGAIFFAEADNADEAITKLLIYVKGSTHVEKSSLYDIDIGDNNLLTTIV